MHALLLVYHLLHLPVLLGQQLKLAFDPFLIWEGLGMRRILLLKCINFNLHVLDTEILEL